jgi:hypothetical protein
MFSTFGTAWCTVALLLPVSFGHSQPQIILCRAMAKHRQSMWDKDSSCNPYLLHIRAHITDLQQRGVISIHYGQSTILLPDHSLSRPVLVGILNSFLKVPQWGLSHTRYGSSVYTRYGSWVFGVILSEPLPYLKRVSMREMREFLVRDRKTNW